jgi:hypothetical protein
MTYQRFETTRDKAAWYKSKAMAAWNEAERFHAIALKYGDLLNRLAHGTPPLKEAAYIRKQAQALLRSSPRPSRTFNKPTF